MATHDLQKLIERLENVTNRLEAASSSSTAGNLHSNLKFLCCLLFDQRLFIKY